MTGMWWKGPLAFVAGGLVTGVLISLIPWRWLR